MNLIKTIALLTAISISFGSQLFAQHSNQGVAQNFIYETHSNTSNGYLFTATIEKIRIVLGREKMILPLSKLGISNSSAIDEAFMRELQDLYHKKVSPEEFFKGGVPSISDKAEVSNEISITSYFLSREESGKIVVRLALKFIFEGTDPKIEMRDPRIKEILVTDIEEAKVDVVLLSEKLDKRLKDAEASDMPPPPPSFGN